MLNVLVTGGAGYIGSHIVRELKKEGFCPIIYDNISNGHRASINGTIFIEGDLRNYEHLDQVFKDLEIAAVIHMAASSVVSESVLHPRHYYFNNLTCGLNLLNVMRENNVPHLVFSSTAAVYGVPNKFPITECAETRPVNPYGKSKLMFEEILADYHIAYGMQYASLRYFNAAGADPKGDIGEDHTPETHLIPNILAVALQKAYCIEIYGANYNTPDGTCIRDYIHVTDLARAHILALRHLLDGGRSTIYNLGSEVGYSVREVIEEVERQIDKPILRRSARARAGDPSRLVAGAKKIQTELGWQPRYGLSDIIRTAWQWHSTHPEGYRTVGNENVVLTKIS